MPQGELQAKRIIFIVAINFIDGSGGKPCRSKRVGDRLTAIGVPTFSRSMKASTRCLAATVTVRIEISSHIEIYRRAAALRLRLSTGQSDLRSGLRPGENENSISGLAEPQEILFWEVR